MKLLLDQNLSCRLVPKLADLYPGSSHVKLHGLTEAEDEAIWSFAVRNDFIIVSKDSDFHQRSLLRGHPPKFIYLRLGNCATQRILDVLRTQHDVVKEFAGRAHEAMLVLM